MKRFTPATLLALPFLALAGGPAAAADAQEVLRQEIADACDGAPGKVAREGAIERDLDGDGLEDLIVSHEYITCSGGMMGRSRFCGMQVCSVNVYVRGPRGLALREELLGAGVRVGSGPVPTVTMYQHGGGEWSFRLDPAR